MDGTVVYVLAIVARRAGLRFHQRLSRQRQLHRHGGRRPGCSRPGVAVVWAAFFNFVAAFVVGTAVAKTIGKGLIDAAVVDPNVILAGADRRDRLEPGHLVAAACRLAPRTR